MNILIFNEAAWDDKNSFGNTISNFFCGDVWKNELFFNFYVRNQIPDNKASVKYFNFSVFDILHGCKAKGKSFSTDEIREKEGLFSNAHKKEQRRIDRIHRESNQLIYYVYELVWRSKVWINKSFIKFILEANPDILFAFTTSPYILWPLISILKSKTNCKVVLLCADDVYGQIETTAFYRRRYLKSGFLKCIKSADRLYSISDEMAALYRKQFNLDVDTLYKGCDLSLSPKGFVEYPIKMVYAGNLLWGRDEILERIGEQLERINKDSHLIELEIYTGSTITDSIKTKLNKGMSSHIMGIRPYNEIKRIMHEADIVLHVESFNLHSIEKVKYSFSTKIIDCLQSGVQVLGIGPKGISSIEYLKKVDGVIVVEELSKLSEVLETVSHNTEMLISNAEKTYQFALKYHEISNVQMRLYNDFYRLLLG